MFDKVQFSRRRFLGTTALAIVAAQFNGIGSAKARSEPSKFDGATAWINSKPLSSTSLHGKVVLVDFWTYSCINWRRQVPYVRAWAKKYMDHGLVVIGVHSPEFSLRKTWARWRQDGKDSSRLYRGVQLAAAREAARVWAADPGRYPALPAAEAEFLRASGRAGTRAPVGAPHAGRRPGPAAPRRPGRGGARGPLGPGRRQPAAHRGDCRRGSPGRARRWKPPTRSPRRCSPGPRGGSRRPRRPGTACSSRWPSRCAASCPRVRAR